MKDSNAQSSTTVPVPIGLEDAYWIAKAREVYRTIDAFGWRIDWPHDRPVPDDAWPIDIIAAALRKASETVVTNAQ